jgi:hypothetical protein
VFVVSFLIAACNVSITPTELYKLFPPGSNFYTFAKHYFSRFPGESDPLAIHLVFGIDVDDPLDYGALKSDQ